METRHGNSSWRRTASSRHALLLKITRKRLFRASATSRIAKPRMGLWRWLSRRSRGANRRNHIHQPTGVHASAVVFTSKFESTITRTQTVLGCTMSTIVSVHHAIDSSPNQHCEDKEGKTLGLAISAVHGIKQTATGKKKEVYHHLKQTWESIAYDAASIRTYMPCKINVVSLRTADMDHHQGATWAHTILPTNGTPPQRYPDFSGVRTRHHREHFEILGRRTWDLCTVQVPFGETTQSA